MDTEKLIKTAKDLYVNKGFSCSESVLEALKLEGYDAPQTLIDSISGLRAGMGGAGCVCGALIAGVMYSGYKLKDKDASASKAREMHDKFKGKFKSTCCRVLTRKYDFKSPERKEFCSGLVEHIIRGLEPILDQK